MKSTSISRKKATLWHLVFSYSTIFYSIITGLLLVPLYLRHIPFELYGAWLATGNIINWALAVDPGLPKVILQRVGQSYGAGKLDLVGQYALSGLLITFFLSITILALGLSIASYLPSWINISDNSSSQILIDNFIIGIFSATLTLFSFSLGMVNLGLQQTFTHGIIYFFANLISIVTTVVLLFFNFGLYALSLGQLVRASIFSLVSLLFMLWMIKKNSIKLALNKTTTCEMFSLLSFTSLGKMGGLLSKNMDAFLIARFIGPDKVPIYILTRRGLDVAYNLLSRTGTAMSPSLSHLSGESNPQKMRMILNRLLRLNLWVLGLAFGGFLAFNQGFITVWVGESLFAGSAVSALFCVFMVLTLIFTLLQTLCVALGDIKRNAVVQFIQAIIIFAGLLVGTYYFGLVGAAVAPVLGYLAVSLWYYPRSITRHGSLEAGDVAKLGLEAGLCLGLGLIFAIPFGTVAITSWWELIFWGSMFSLSYGLVLISIRPMVRAEMQAFKNMVMAKLAASRGRATT